MFNNQVCGKFDATLVPKAPFWHRSCQGSDNIVGKNTKNVKKRMKKE
uniref:Uncharacterized protein n=1 Tax=viral metagenome TaxID=1070528 RepID=A0A6C0H656_9ZZZZ